MNNYYDEKTETEKHMKIITVKISKIAVSSQVLQRKLLKLGRNGNWFNQETIRVPYGLLV
jgi:hypothetical protein